MGQGRLKICRQWRLKAHSQSRDRVVQHQLTSMQCLAAHARGDSAGIGFIGEQGMAQPGQMHPHLMSSAGVQAAAQQAGVGCIFQQCDISPGSLTWMQR